MTQPDHRFNRSDYVLVVGLALLAAGLGWSSHPGVGIAAAGLFCALVGLALKMG